jgi:hypothetical protein
MACILRTAYGPVGLLGVNALGPQSLLLWESYVQQRMNSCVLFVGMISYVLLLVDMISSSLLLVSSVVLLLLTTMFRVVVVAVC